MKLSKILLISISIISIASLSGCAGHPMSTPYQPDKGSFRGGYKDIQLSENMYKVSFKGNAYLSQSTTKDYTLLRSAEVCLENGFDYFSVVGSNSSVDHSLYQQAGTLNTYQPMAGGPSSVTYEAGKNIIFKKPTSENNIVCYNDENSYRNSYNARMTIKSMINSYSINYNKPHLLNKQSPVGVVESNIKIKVPSYADIPSFVPFTATFNNPIDTDKIIIITNGRMAYIIRPGKGIKISAFSGRVRAFNLKSKINIKVQEFDSVSLTAGQILDEKTSYYTSKSKALVPLVVDDSVRFIEKFTNNKLRVLFDNKLGKDEGVLFNLDTSKGKIQIAISDGASGKNGEKYLDDGVERELSGFFSIKGNFDDASVSLVEMKELPLKTKKTPKTIELSWDKKRTYEISPGDYIVTNSGYKYDYKKIKLNDLKLDNGDVLYSHNGKKKVAFDSMSIEQLDSSKSSAQK